ncbi:MAG: LLM class flavin-dependent oxidoreductase, partial [Anaerolineae bacterium]|nr:LLM class flavin-dependent oxidoreductase [Anaerolineae bacterium]
GYFMWDHIAMWWAATSYPVVDAWVTLAAVAAVTERIAIGALVTPIPRRRPWKLARETVALDRLSGGRLIFGAGTGGGTPEFDDLGEEADPKVRAAMLDEGLVVLAGLWSGEPFHHDGEFYHVRRAHFTPPPVQKPRIPVWVGGFWPNKAPFRRAARWDGCFPLLSGDPPPDITVEDIKAIMDYIHAHRPPELAGKPFDMALSNGRVGEDPAALIDRVGAYEAAGVTWWVEQVNPWRFGWREEGPWPLEAMRERVLAGPPRA